MESLIIKNFISWICKFNELLKSLNWVFQKVLINNLRQLEENEIIYIKDYKINLPKVIQNINCLNQLIVRVIFLWFNV